MPLAIRPAGVVTGSTGLVQKTQERGAELQRGEDLRRLRELRRGTVEGET